MAKLINKNLQWIHAPMPTPGVRRSCILCARAELSCAHQICTPRAVLGRAHERPKPTMPPRRAPFLLSEGETSPRPPCDPPETRLRTALHHAPRRARGRLGRCARGHADALAALGGEPRLCLAVPPDRGRARAPAPLEAAPLADLELADVALARGAGERVKSSCGPLRGGAMRRPASRAISITRTSSRAPASFGKASG